MKWHKNSYFPLCDVDKCKEESCNNGTYYRPEYWCLCTQHAADARAGKPKPKMKAVSIKREKSRDPVSRCLGDKK